MESKVNVKLGRNLTDLQIRKYELISLASRVRALRLLRGLTVNEMLERYLATDRFKYGIFVVFERFGREFFDDVERGKFVNSLPYGEVVGILEALISNLEWNPEEDDLASSRCVSPLMNHRYV